MAHPSPKLANISFLTSHSHVDTAHRALSTHIAWRLATDARSFSQFLQDSMVDLKEKAFPVSWKSVHPSSVVGGDLGVHL